jgi:hypothetical protein
MSAPNREFAMSAPAQPEPTTPAPAERAALRLVVVSTPQPPVVAGPVRWILPGVRPPRPSHRPGPRPVVSVRPDDFGPTWSTRAELPDARAAGRRLVTTALEALTGRRPMAQVQPLTSPGVFTALVRNRPPWCTAGTAPLIIGSVHVCEPVDGVAEVSAVARRAGRAHAVAGRLEGIDGRWRCTALQIG